MKRFPVVMMVILAAVILLLVGSLLARADSDEPKQAKDACVLAQTEEDSRLQAERQKLCEANNALAVLQEQTRQIEKVGKELKGAADALDAALKKMQEMRCAMQRCL